MRKAISTKFLGPTNSRGSRYKASAEGGHSFTMPADYSVNYDANHAAAAQFLAQRLNWDGLYVGGGTKDGFVFVNVGVPAFREVPHTGSIFGTHGVDWFYVKPSEAAQ